jgi:hypothetical protein
MGVDRPNHYPYKTTKQLNIFNLKKTFKSNINDWARDVDIKTSHESKNNK